MAETDQDDLGELDELEVVEEETPQKIPARTSLLTTGLVVGNLLATVGFGMLLYMDVGKRLDWSRAVLLRDLAIVGMPFDETEIGKTNPEAGLQGKFDLDPPLVKEAYKARGGKSTDRFMSVNENFSIDIRPADLSSEILAKYFGDAGAGTPVGTIQQEIQQLTDKVPNDIDAAAQAVASKAKGKSAEEKQALLEKILFPLCPEGTNVDAMQEEILKKRTAKQEEAFIADAAKRRMYFDILKPLEVFRPTAKPAKLDQLDAKKLKELFVKRCGDAAAAQDWADGTIKRDKLEKRRYAAFLLAAVSQVEIPGAERAELKAPVEKAAKAPKKEKDKDADPKDEDEKKAGDQPEPKAEAQRAQRQLAFANIQKRAEAVCGLRDFDQAYEDMAVVTEIMEKQMIAAIQRDLGTFRFPVGDASATGFIGNYDASVKRVQELAMLVERRERQLLELKNVHDERARQLETRTAQEKEAIDKLFEIRAQTRQLALDLKILQDELFIAQINLRGAHEYIQYLVERLQAIELTASRTKKGAGQ